MEKSIKGKAFVIDDEQILRVTLADDLRDEGLTVFEFSAAAGALQLLETEQPDFVFTDVRMPGMSGLEFLQKATKISPRTIFFVLTAYGTIEDAVAAIKYGAFDYVLKPYNFNHLLTKIKQAQNIIRLQEENTELKSKLFNNYDFSSFVGQSPGVKEIFRQLEIVLHKNTSVLLEGETGTGKELLANIIHYNSPRKDKPLIKVSCAVLAREIFESELFGHEKGAFTGAETQKTGRFEMANHGTLYLDDIDDIPYEMQVKLLRVLEEGEIERLGSGKPIKIDVRIISSTKVNLLELVKEGKFREDLYYRLNVFPVKIPPLRERPEDIKHLINFFIRKFSEFPGQYIDQEALEILLSYPFPGNVRELRNMVERLTLLAGKEPIQAKHLPAELLNVSPEYINPSTLIGRPYQEILEDFEKQIIGFALKKSDGNKAKAAELLKLPVTTLRSKIDKLFG